MIKKQSTTGLEIAPHYTSFTNRKVEVLGQAFDYDFVELRSVRLGALTF